MKILQHNYKILLISAITILLTSVVLYFSFPEVLNKDTKAAFEKLPYIRISIILTIITFLYSLVVYNQNIIEVLTNKNQYPAAEVTPYIIHAHLIILSLFIVYPDPHFLNFIALFGIAALHLISVYFLSENLKSTATTANY